MSGYTTGDNNQLLTDGTYTYTYDDEGNRVTRTNDTTDEVTEYEWDFRNRLVNVTDKDDEGTTVQVVTYQYDVFNRRISRAVDTAYPFDMDDAVVERYVYDDVNGVTSEDGGNVVLDFVDDDGPGGEGSLALVRRYLYSHAVDQILAQEDVTEAINSADRVLWPLGDHLGTTRDLYANDGTASEHYSYGSFGDVVSGDVTRTRYFFTAREHDEATKLQNNRARWYDSTVGRWVSEDPIGFGAKDYNISRYVANSPGDRCDPSGLETTVQLATSEGIKDSWLGGLADTLLSWLPAVLGFEQNVKANETGIVDALRDGRGPLRAGGHRHFDDTAKALLKEFSTAAVEFNAAVLSGAFLVPGGPGLAIEGLTDAQNAKVRAALKEIASSAEIVGDFRLG